MSDEAPVLMSRAIAGEILDSLAWLEKQAFEELKRIGARYFLDRGTRHPLPLIEQYKTYLSMAHDWPNTRALRQEFHKLSDDQLLSAAKLFEILSFAHWTRICVARGEDSMYLLSVALERLSAVPIKELVASWNLATGRLRGGKSAPKAKAAVVKLLEKLLQEHDELQAKDLWDRVGSPTVKRYRHVEIGGEQYEFEKDEAGDLAVYRISPQSGRQKVKSQPFNSTFRRWCQQAKANLSSPSS